VKKLLGSKPFTRTDAIWLGLLVVMGFALLIAVVLYGPVFDWNQRAAELDTMLRHAVSPN
jgi:hypothetical protein